MKKKAGQSKTPRSIKNLSAKPLSAKSQKSVRGGIVCTKKIDSANQKIG